MHQVLIRSTREAVIPERATKVSVNPRKRAPSNAHVAF